jgi:hypothetical protein
MTIAVALLAALQLAALGLDGPSGSAAPDAPPAAEVEPARSPWWFALGLGSGNAVLSLAGGDRTVRSVIGGDPARIALQVGAGVSVGPKLLVGLELAALRAGAAVADPVLGDVRRAVQLTNLDLLLTFYPSGRGFFVRGGGGLSSLGIDEHASSVNHHDRYGGLNVAGGVGYAWWIGRRFNFLLDLDASRHRLFHSAAGPTSASYWMLFAGIGWY